MVVPANPNRVRLPGWKDEVMGFGGVFFGVEALSLQNLPCRLGPAQRVGRTRSLSNKLKSIRASGHEESDRLERFDEKKQVGSE